MKYIVTQGPLYRRVPFVLLRRTVRSKSPFLPYFHGFLAPTATLTSISGVLFEIERAHTILRLFIYEVTRSP